MGTAELLRRAVTDERAGSGQAEPDQQPGEGLGAAVAIRMVLIGRLGGERQSEQHEAGSEDVAGRFESVGHHRRGMSAEAKHDFDGSERAAHQHSGDGQPLTDVHSQAGSSGAGRVGTFGCDLQFREGGFGAGGVEPAVPYQP
jgi:hypothetical protein